MAAAKKTAAAEMSRRALRALYDAGEGMTGEELIPLISLTGAEARSWGILLNLVEASRVDRSGVGDEARYTLSADEREAVFMEIFMESGDPGEDPGEEHDGDS
jgi:hypothetical protein